MNKRPFRQRLKGTKKQSAFRHVHTCQNLFRFSFRYFHVYAHLYGYASVVLGCPLRRASTPYMIARSSGFVSTAAHPRDSSAWLLPGSSSVIKTTSAVL